MSDPTPTAAAAKARRERGRPAGPEAADRVRVSHAQTRLTVRFALAFVVAAVVAAAGGWRWLALHLLLSGGVVLAISGVSLMLTVTWSAAPAPQRRWVNGQRLCIAIGAAGVALGRQTDFDPAVGVAGAIYVGGLVVLAVLLVTTVRRGVERRFDVAVVSYVAAIVAGVAGVVLGAAMRIGAFSATGRPVHVTLNLLGLVGLVVAGTMPFFAATVVRSKMSPRATPRRHLLTVAAQGVALVVTAAALAGKQPALASVGFLGYAVGIVAVLDALPRPTRRQLDWAGPRLVALWAGGLWWVTAVVATAVDAAGDRDVVTGRWVAVLVVAGYGQILWGSLAYLLPMLRGGGHERLGEGFAATRSWIGLAAVNIAGLAAALALPTIVTVAVVVWVIDGAWRTARVGTTRAPRPSVD